MSLRELLRFVVLSGIFAVSFICLYVADGMFFPFITGKNFIFRILVEIMLGAWVILMFLDAQYRPKFSYALAAAGAFLAIIAIADFSGANPFRSFWSNYERMEGLVTHVHLFLFFLISGTVLAEEKLWLWFFRTTLGVSVITSFHGFAQLAGSAEIHQSANRLDASFGNSTYLAIFALFHIFLAGFLWFRERGTNTAFRFVYPVIALMNLVMLYYTQTRGTMLGLIAGALLSFLLIALFDKDHPKLKKYALGGIAGIFVFIAGFIMVRDAAFVKESPVLERFASISLSDMTTNSRFMIWRMSYEGFKEHPLLGWGQENFIYVFSKYYDPEMYAQEPWFDRSHDVFFDWLVAAGSLGLTAYLSLFGVILYYLWFGKKKPFSVVERAILTGMLAGYFIHNVFVFDNLTSYIIFFAVLGYIHSMYREEPEPAPVVKEKGKKKHTGLDAQDVFVVTCVVMLATGALVYFVNLRNLNANFALINSLRNPIVQNADKSFTVTLQSVLERPDGTPKRLFGLSEAREQLGQLAYQAQDQRVDPGLRTKIYELAKTHFDDEIARDPENLRYQSFVASFYARYGQFEKADEYYRNAIALSPTRQMLYMDRGMMYLQNGRVDAALADLKKAYDLAPTYIDAMQQYGLGLIYARQYDEALRVTAPNKQYQVYYDTRMINAWGSMGQFDKVVEMVNEKIGKGWDSGRDYLALGGAYFELKEKDKAIAAVQNAVAKDASLKDQADSILKQLTETGAK